MTKKHGETKFGAHQQNSEMIEQITDRKRRLGGGGGDTQVIRAKLGGRKQSHSPGFLVRSSVLGVGHVVNIKILAEKTLHLNEDKKRSNPLKKRKKIIINVIVDFKFHKLNWKSSRRVWLTAYCTAYQISDSLKNEISGQRGKKCCLISHKRQHIAKLLYFKSHKFSHGKLVFSYFRTFEKVQKFISYETFFLLRGSRISASFCFEALETMKISSNEPVSSQKYENGYRTKICDFTVRRTDIHKGFHGKIIGLKRILIF